MPANWVQGALSNFGFTMLVVAAIFILLHRAIRRTLPEAEIVYRWVALFALGFTAIYAAILHAFFPALTAANIGWHLSPFQFEVAIANLGFGVIAILSFNASYGFRLATVIGSTIWLWGDAVGHIYQIIKVHNYSPGNAGTWLWMDILVPLILLFALRGLKRLDKLR